MNQPDPSADIFRALYPALRRYAAVVGSSGDDPDDLVQEALARVLRSKALAEIRHPEAYLRRSISNIVIDRYRRTGTRRDRRHLVAVDAEDHDVYPSDLGLLDELSALDRAIVYLVDIEGRRFDEVADIVGCTSTAARIRASRARRHLRQLLEEQT